jgi:Ca-activated chloride channel family protein
MTFASGVDAMSSKMKRGDDAGKQDGYRFIGDMNASGGTEMKMGVVEMLAKKPGDNRVRMIYFLTDGFVGNDDVVIGAAHELLGSNRIFTVGVGEAPNRSLLDNLADVGRGFSTYVSLREDPAKMTRDLLRRSAKPYLTDITVDWKELGIRQQDPAIIPDLYAGMPLILSGIYETPKRGTIYIRGNSGGQQITIPVEVDLPEKNVLPPIGSLWARRRIEQLSRPSDIPNNVVEDRITQIGLLFGLMTEYTSFLAVDRTRVVMPGGATKLVEQPAIVPEGVDGDKAIGSHGGETFKPTGTWRETGERQRSYNGGSSRSSRGAGGGGGGGGLFGSGASPETPLATYLLFALLALLGTAWLVVRRRIAARPLHAPRSIPDRLDRG